MSLSLADARAHFGRVQTKSYMGHRLKVHSVAWNGTGDKLASGSVDKTIHVWTIDRIGQVPAYLLHPRYYTCHGR